MHIQINIDIYVYIHTYLYVCVYIHVHVYLCKHLYLDKRTHVDAYVYIYSAAGNRYVSSSLVALNKEYTIQLLEVPAQT